MAYELITKYKGNMTSYTSLGKLNDAIFECEKIRGREIEFCKLVHTNELNKKVNEININFDDPQDSIQQILKKVNNTNTLTVA